MKKPKTVAFNGRRKQTHSIGVLIKLWFVAEELNQVCSNEFDEETYLESLRDSITDEQSSIARQILLLPAKNIEHLVGKLKIWSHVCDAYEEEPANHAGEPYERMVSSVMRDIETITSMDVELASI